MGKIISIINDKGGCGKTTTAVSLAFYLQSKGADVAIGDVDPRYSACDYCANAAEHGYKTPLAVGMFSDNVGEELLKLKKKFDYVIVDSMSSFVEPARARKIAGIIKVSDQVFIPLQPSPLDYWAIVELSEMIQTRHTLTDGLPKTNFFAYGVFKNSKLFKELVQEQGELAFPLLENYMPLLEDMKHMVKVGKTPIDLPKNSKARISVEALLSEMEGIINE